MLARGGMGSVWRARHVLLETPVAIKFIGADVFALQEARRRFEREAKAAALLQSPHVVRIHDYGLEGDVPYLVMELLEGEDLGEALKRRGKLTPEETANIVIQVARALRRAAEAGIVHRDLKPSNVFILRDDDDEDLIKVLDFGIAKAPRDLRGDDDATRKGAVIGSPRYMSPEQARGSPLVDPRSDLWSLGVIAYRAVTGELPFQSLDMNDLLVKICSEDPTPPSQIDRLLGPEMDDFFACALDRNPDQALPDGARISRRRSPSRRASRRPRPRLAPAARSATPSGLLEVPASVRPALAQAPPANPRPPPSPHALTCVARRPCRRARVEVRDHAHISGQPAAPDVRAHTRCRRSRSSRLHAGASATAGHARRAHAALGRAAGDARPQGHAPDAVPQRRRLAGGPHRAPSAAGARPAPGDRRGSRRWCWSGSCGSRRGTAAHCRRPPSPAGAAPERSRRPLRPTRRPPSGGSDRAGRRAAPETPAPGRHRQHRRQCPPPSAQPALPRCRASRPSRPRGPGRGRGRRRSTPSWGSDPTRPANTENAGATRSRRPVRMPPTASARALDARLSGAPRPRPFAARAPGSEEGEAPDS